MNTARACLQATSERAGTVLHYFMGAQWGAPFNLGVLKG